VLRQKKFLKQLNNPKRSGVISLTFGVFMEEILNFILHKFKNGKTWTTVRVWEIPLYEQTAIQKKLADYGLHSSIEEEIITVWVN
jgi:hypothetical protein